MSLSDEFFNNLKYAETNPAALAELEKIIIKEKINPCEHRFLKNSSVNVTLLGMSIAQHKTKIAKLFFKYSDESKTPDNFISPWLSLTNSGKLSDIQKMAKLSNTTINRLDSEGCTPLASFFKVHAKQKKKNKSLKFEDIVDKKLTAFLEAGADINCYYHNLHFVAHMTKHFNILYNDYHKIIDFALQHHFDPNLTYINGNNYFQHLLYNPYHYRIEKIEEAFLKVMQYRQVDLDYKNKSDQTIMDMLPALPPDSEVRVLLEQQFLQQKTQQDIKPALLNKTRL